MLIRYLTAFFAILISSHTFAGEIFRCVDAHGNKSFSHKPCPDVAISGSSDTHVLWRTLRELTLKGTEISRSLGANTQAIMHCKNDVKTLNSSLQDLQDEIESIKYKHPMISKAYNKLQDCAVCRSSARRACDDAYATLNLAMNRIMFDRGQDSH